MYPYISDMLAAMMKSQLKAGVWYMNIGNENTVSAISPRNALYLVAANTATASTIAIAIG